MIRSIGKDGCFFGYISQCDPQGKLPSWFINKLTQVFAPKFFKRLQNAVRNYDTWKKGQSNPGFKPWLNPEQIQSPKIPISDVCNFQKLFNPLRLILSPYFVQCRPCSQELLTKEQKRIRKRSSVLIASASSDT